MNGEVDFKELESDPAFWDWVTDHAVQPGDWDSEAPAEENE